MKGKIKMEGEINIIESFVQAISILNKTDEYLDSLVDRLSECDKLETDYRHFIELNDLENIDLNKLFLDIQLNLKKRRKIKQDLTLKTYIDNNLNKLSNKSYREFFIQGIKKTNSKLETEYQYRILADDSIDKFMKNEQVKEKKGRGRPKKIKEEVINNA